MQSPYAHWGARYRAWGAVVFLMPENRPRPEVAENLVQLLRRSGLQVVPPTGWESYDAVVMASALVGAEVVTSAHPPGWVQLRIRRYLRWKPALVVAAAFGIASVTDARMAVVIAVVSGANVLLGIWRTGPGIGGALNSRDARG